MNTQTTIQFKDEMITWGDAQRLYTTSAISWSTFQSLARQFSDLGEFIPESEKPKDIKITADKLDAIMDELKLTKPQAGLARMFICGYVLVLINRHRMNGGEYVWQSPYSAPGDYDHAGHVYKALQGLDRAVRKQYDARMDVWGSFTKLG